MIALSAKQWKIVGLCVAGLILLGIVLFAFDSCGGYFAQRKIDKLKQNINSATNAVVKLEQQKAVLNERQERALENANVAVQEFNNEVGATEEARKESNKALEALANARNANVANVTVEELQRKLEGLDK